MHTHTHTHTHTQTVSRQADFLQLCEKEKDTPLLPIKEEPVTGRHSTRDPTLAQAPALALQWVWVPAPALALQCRSAEPVCAPRSVRLGLVTELVSHSLVSLSG